MNPFRGRRAAIVTGAFALAVMSCSGYVTGNADDGDELQSRTDGGAVVDAAPQDAAAAVDSKAPAEVRIDHVVIVSIDGGKPLSLKDSDMPIFDKMVRDGASTMKARTIFPSLTLPSHTSMLTGVGPDKHQILWNNYDPSKGIVKVSTVFSVAKKAGKTTALIAGKEKFKHLHVPDSLDFAYYQDNTSIPLTAIATKTLTEKTPALTFLHYPDADAQGHGFGWGSPEQLSVLRNVDTGLGNLLGALGSRAQHTVVIVTADHGGTGKGHGSASDADTEIPWVAYGARVKRGYAVSAPVRQMDTAATALWLLGVPVPSDWDGKPVTTAFEP